MVRAAFLVLVRWPLLEIMKVKELKDFLNSLEEIDLQREVVFNYIEDNIDYAEKVLLTKDSNGDEVLMLVSEFGYYPFD